jgi:hypothetical protein
MRSIRQQQPRISVLHSLCLASARFFLPWVLGLLFLPILSGTAYAAFDIPVYYQQNYGNTFSSAQEFYQKFPFDQYLKQTSLTDFAALQKDRFFLYTKFGDGDEFLYHLTEQFLKLYGLPNVPTPAELNGKIDIGELFLNSNKGFNRQVNEIYVIIGYFILGNVAQKISQQIHSKKYDETESERARIIQRLAKDRVYISRQESTSNKIISHLKNGDWRYLWDRLRVKIHGHKEKLRPILIGGTCASILFFLIGFHRRFKVLRVLGVLGLLLASVPIGVLMFDPSVARAATNRGDGNSRPPPATTSLQLTPLLNLRPINGSDYAVIVYKLTQYNRDIGHVIWMDREAVQVSYLAYENVPGKYQSFQANNRVVLATTGGYTNTYRQPEGFTTEDGNIVNPVIMPDRDGLAMMSGGGINVLNVDPSRDSFQLPGGHVIKNPLNSLLAYAELLKWCKEKKATLFQTHLLATGDNLTIDPTKAPAELRERRILALARDKKTQKLYHVIFNVTQNVNIAQISSEIFGLLQKRNLKVEAMLNLDVGAFNILEVYDDKGNVINNLKAPVQINTATNLLIYKT